MTYPFVVGHQYSRRDVYRLIGVDENTHGGNWDTGYNKHGDDWFIFCNVGVPGRTGHDYENRWDGQRLEWFGKSRTRVTHASVKGLASESSDTYLFWRSDNEAPFTFGGLARADEIVDQIPVKIIWSFESTILPTE